MKIFKHLKKLSVQPSVHPKIIFCREKACERIRLSELPGVFGRALRFQSVVLIALSLPLFLHAALIDPSYDELDGVALVERLISDGRVDDAELSVTQLIEQRRPLAKAEIIRLKGQIAYARGHWAIATEHFSESLAQISAANLQADKAQLTRVYRLRAYAHYQSKNFVACVSDFTISESFKYLSLNPAEQLVLANCLEGSGDLTKAWDQYAQLKETSNEGFIEWLRFLIRNQLVAHARKDVFERIHDRSEQMPSATYILFAELFVSARDLETADMILSFARLLFPLDKELNLYSAQVSFQRRFLVQVAESFNRVALAEPKYGFHAAEIYRQLRLFNRAYLSVMGASQVTEQVKHRVAVMVERSQFAQIFAAQNQILNANLIKEEDVKYALAYAAHSLGEHQKSKNWLQTIRKTEIMPKVLALQKMMSTVD